VANYGILNLGVVANPIIDVTKVTYSDCYRF